VPPPNWALQMQIGFFLLGWDPLGLRQKSAEDVLNRDSGQGLNRGFEFPFSATFFVLGLSGTLGRGHS